MEFLGAMKPALTRLHNIFSSFRNEQYDSRRRGAHHFEDDVAFAALHLQDRPSALVPRENDLGVYPALACLETKVGAYGAAGIPRIHIMAGEFDVGVDYPCISNGILRLVDVNVVLSRRGVL